MAKLDMGILGGFSGRVGTVVGYYRRGAWFVRAYQPHIKDRKSAAQLEQRSRFKAMIQFASPATPVLRVGLRQAAADWQITEGNAFLKINKDCFPRESRISRNTRDSRNTRNTRDSRDSRDSRNSSAIDYPSLQFSQGSYAAPQALQYAVDERGVLAVRWSAAGGRLADSIHIYIYSPAAGHGLAAAAERGQRGVQVLLPEGFAGDELQVWAFAEGRGGAVSATVYGLEVRGQGVEAVDEVVGAGSAELVGGLVAVGYAHGAAAGGAPHEDVIRGVAHHHGLRGGDT